MQNKITWLGLRWQYHVAKQFLYYSHDPRFKPYDVSTRRFVQSISPSDLSMYKCTVAGMISHILGPSKVRAQQVMHMEHLCPLCQIWAALYSVYGIFRSVLLRTDLCIWGSLLSVCVCVCCLWQLSESQIREVWFTNKVGMFWNDLEQCWEADYVIK